MYNIKTENNDTNYQSGDEFHGLPDRPAFWAVGGGTGRLLPQQTEDDKQNGQTVGPDGNRGQVFAFGPAVKYDYKGMSFIGTWDHETDVKNRFQATSSISSSSPPSKR